jgi:transcriptional regulator with XRE-family HTH domain
MPFNFGAVRRQCVMPPVAKPQHDRSRTYLAEWRRFRKLNQEDIADRTEVDRTTVGRIERGEIPYNQDFLERFATSVGCDPTDLLNINPLEPDPSVLLFSRLRTAPRAVQERALAVLDALLKAG